MGFLDFYAIFLCYELLKQQEDLKQIEHNVSCLVNSPVCTASSLLFRFTWFVHIYKDNLFEELHGIIWKMFSCSI